MCEKGKKLKAEPDVFEDILLYLCEQECRAKFSFIVL